MNRLHPIATVLLVLLAAIGVWVIVAPFALGYQPVGAAWTLTTRNDILTGGLLLAISLAGLVCSVIMTVRARLRAVADERG